MTKLEKQKQMSVLMSIKPKYVEQIFNGSKKVEFRKQMFRSSDKVYVYETNPVKKVVGYFYYNNIYVDDPLNVWLHYWKVSGMSIKDFEAYYKQSKKAVAIEISKVIPFEKGIDIKKFDYSGTVPQSFRYTNR